MRAPPSARRPQHIEDPTPIAHPDLINVVAEVDLMSDNSWSGDAQHSAMLGSLLSSGASGDVTEAATRPDDFQNAEEHKHQSNRSPQNLQMRSHWQMMEDTSTSFQRVVPQLQLPQLPQHEQNNAGLFGALSSVSVPESPFPYDPTPLPSGNASPFDVPHAPDRSRVAIDTTQAKSPSLKRPPPDQSRNDNFFTPTPFPPPGFPTSNDFAQVPSSNWNYSPSPSASANPSEYSRSEMPPPRQGPAIKRSKTTTTTTSATSTSSQSNTQRRASLNETASSSNSRSGSIHFRDYQAEQWLQRYQDLVAYKQEYGDCNVPHNYRDDPRLAQWVKRQRYQYRVGRQSPDKRSTITPERFRLLDGLGFRWDYYADAWDERWQELNTFREKSGHCKVPRSYNRRLWTWVKHQRRYVRKFRATNEETSNMTMERYRRLEEIGFMADIIGPVPSASTTSSGTTGQGTDSTSSDDDDDDTAKEYEDSKPAAM